MKKKTKQTVVYETIVANPGMDMKSLKAKLSRINPNTFGSVIYQLKQSGKIYVNNNTVWPAKQSEIKPLISTDLDKLEIIPTNDYGFYIITAFLVLALCSVVYGILKY